MMRKLRRLGLLVGLGWVVFTRIRRQGVREAFTTGGRLNRPSSGLEGTILQGLKFMALRELGFFSVPGIALRLGLRFFKRRTA